MIDAPTTKLPAVLPAQPAQAEAVASQHFPAPITATPVSPDRELTVVSANAAEEMPARTGAVAALTRPIVVSAPAPGTAGVEVAIDRPGVSFAVPDASPTTVHVTIGRIEVRATQPVTKGTVKASTPSPSVTLDDYLRRRAEGHDR